MDTRIHHIERIHLTPISGQEGPYSGKKFKENLDPLLSLRVSASADGKEGGRDGEAHWGRPSYLGDTGIADLGHDVADVLKNKEACIQAPKVELILSVIVYDFSTPDHVLETHEHVGIKA